MLIWACWGCNRRHPRCCHRLGRRIVRLPCECVRSRACPRPRAHSRPICLTLLELPLRRSDAPLQSYLSNWEHYVEKHGNLSALEAAGKTFDASEKNAGCHLRNCEKSPIKLPASPYSCRAHTPSSPTVALIALLKTPRLFFSMERGMGEHLSNGGDSWSCDGEISRACACAKIVFKLHACTHPHKRTHWHRELGQDLSLAGRAYWFRSAYLKPPNTTKL